MIQARFSHIVISIFISLTEENRTASPFPSNQETKEAYVTQLVKAVGNKSKQIMQPTIVNQLRLLSWY